MRFPSLKALRLLVLVAAAGCSEEEGDCFAPGETCGSGACSQSAYCGPNQACVSKGADGTSCTEARQCLGAQCVDQRCAGGPLVCKNQ